MGRGQASGARERRDRSGMGGRERHKRYVLTVSPRRPFLLVSSQFRAAQHPRQRCRRQRGLLQGQEAHATCEAEARVCRAYGQARDGRPLHHRRRDTDRGRRHGAVGAWVAGEGRRGRRTAGGATFSSVVPTTSLEADVWPCRAPSYFLS